MVLPFLSERVCHDDNALQWQCFWSSALVVVVVMAMWHVCKTLLQELHRMFGWGWSSGVADVFLEKRCHPLRAEEKPQSLQTYTSCLRFCLGEAATLWSLSMLVCVWERVGGEVLVFDLSVCKVKFFFFSRLKFKKCCALRERPVDLFLRAGWRRGFIQIVGREVSVLVYSAHVGVLSDASSVIVLAVMAKLDKKTFPFP